MKTKILFVDDEAFLLRDLQRLLWSMRPEWEMAFAGSGAEALDRMTQTTFDVVVSDMHMPQMNGVDLLNEVMKRHPQTIRFLLASHTDLEALYKSGTLSHQFLLKPCDERTLKSAVAGALKRENSSVSESLRKVLAKIHQLPSIPTLYLELIKLIEDPAAGIDEIGSVIAKDIAMTAIVLRFVNSAYFGLRHRVSSVTDAAKYLGVETLRSLVLSIKAFSQFGAVEIEGFSAEALWKHSMETAIAAKTIARLEGAGQKMSDEAFVGGMLHDIGKLVLVVNLQDASREVFRIAAARRISDYEAEKTVLGATHADVGGHILSYWGLPLPIVEAIGCHHEPSRSGQTVFGPLTVVHAANAILQQQKEREASPATALDMEYLEELGLADRLDVWREALGNLDRESLDATGQIPWQQEKPAPSRSARQAPRRR
ncbi:MAG: response regulator [Chthoniobacteraceae bacterium]|nr:response regulator [Chthoniobacteraceae bacterium]